MKKPIIIMSAVFLVLILTSVSYGQACQRLKPVVTLSPTSVSGPSDNTYFLTLTIKNEDTQACGSTGFNISTSLPQGWTSFIRSTPKTIFPQQAEIVTVDVRVPKGAEANLYQAIIVVESPNHNTPSLKDSKTASITIREEPKTCRVSVDDIFLRKAGTDVEKTSFCVKEKIEVGTKVSLPGNTESQVNVDLFVDGKLLDSNTVNIKPDNFVTINFKNTIDTQAFGKSTPNVKVVAKAACTSTQSSKERRATIENCDPSCLFTTSIAAPLEKQVGEDIIISIYTRNIGNKENLIAIESAMCKGDCIPMVCEISSVRLQPDESKSYSCRQKVKELGSHEIKTTVFSCGKEETQSKGFFGIASAAPSAVEGGVSTECKVEPLNESRCSGSIRQQLFRNSDCSTTWTYSQYCPDGCSNGLCVSAGEDVTGFEPLLTVDETMEGKSGEDVLMEFEIENELNSPAKFDIQVTGSAADWISTPSSVIIGERDKEKIIFSATIPEDAKAGEYDFTVTVSTGARSVSKSSLLRVSEEPKPLIPPSLLVGLVIILLAVFLISYSMKYMRRRKEAF